MISMAHPDNAASRRVMVKVGLAITWGERRWEERDMDVVWYSNQVEA